MYQNIQLISIIFSDLKSSLISLVLGYIVYKIVKFYYHVSQLPPGPLPIPFMGNMLCKYTKMLYLS